MSSNMQPVVMVTGCSVGGIGYSLCETFAAAGCRVFATARQLNSMSGLERAGVTLLQLDVTSSDSIKAAVEEVIQGAGRIDILVNNAGQQLKVCFYYTRLRLKVHALVTHTNCNSAVCKAQTL